MSRDRSPSPVPMSTFGTYKAVAAKAAKELGYGKEVVKEVKNAQSEREVTLIMATARERQTAMDNRLERMQRRMKK